MVNIYQGSLSAPTDKDEFEMSLVAGDKSFTITFAWPTQIQELYDAAKALYDSIFSFPLYNTEDKTLIKDWDIHSYFQNEELPTFIPYSYIDLTNEEREERWDKTKALENTIYNALSDYEESLKWGVVVRDENNEVRSFPLIPNAIINDDSYDWTLRFVCSRDPIGKDDLPYVKIIAEVHSYV